MLLSIITINYNNKKGLERTLNSISKQTYQDYELIIIDGGSKDGSIDIIHQYENRFKNLYYKSEKDHGIYNAMNKGIDLSHGNYCIFMNSGDCFFNNMSIEHSIPYLKTNIDIISGIAISNTYKMIPVKPKDLSLSFFLKNSLNHQSTYIKRQLLVLNHYNENYRIVSDTEFFFKVLILDNCSYLNIPINVSFCEEAGTSGNLQASLEERYIAIKKLLPKRFENDIEFIIKYNNPVVRKFGDVVYNNFFRFLYDKLIRRGGRD